MIGTRDGGFLVVESASTTLEANQSIEVIKFNSEANIEWAGLYNGTLCYAAFGVTESQDGGYLITGNSYSYEDYAKTSVFALKVSSTGQEIWSKLIGGLSGHSFAN